MTKHGTGFPFENFTLVLGSLWCLQFNFVLSSWWRCDCFSLVWWCFDFVISPLRLWDVCSLTLRCFHFDSKMFSLWLWDVFTSTRAETFSLWQPGDSNFDNQVTASTVGYGDICVRTSLGKLAVALLLHTSYYYLLLLTITYFYLLLLTITYLLLLKVLSLHPLASLSLLLINTGVSYSLTMDEW